MAQWGSNDSSLSDSDIETINSEELVLFETTRTFYTNSSGSAVDHSPRDWIGLFQSGWQTPSDFSTFQWVPIDPISAWHPRKRRTIFPQADVNDLSGDFQFLYITCQQDVIGVSEIFQIIDVDLVASIHDKLPHSLSLISLETDSSSSEESQTGGESKDDVKNPASEHDVAKPPEPEAKPRTPSPLPDNWTLSDFVIGVHPDIFCSRLRFADDVKDIVEEYEPLKNFSSALRQSKSKLVEEVDAEIKPDHVTLNAGSELNLRGRGFGRGNKPHDYQHHPYLRQRPSLVLSVSRDNFKRSCLESCGKTSSDPILCRQLDTLHANPLISHVENVKKWSNSLQAEKSSSAERSPVATFGNSESASSKDVDVVHRDTPEAPRPKQTLPIFRKKQPVENDEDINPLPLALPTPTLKFTQSSGNEFSRSAMFTSLITPTVSKISMLPLFDVNRGLLSPALAKIEAKKGEDDDDGLLTTKRGNPMFMLADSLAHLVSDQSISRLGSFTTGTGSKTTSKSSVNKLRVSRPRKRLGQTVSCSGSLAKRLRLSGKTGAVAPSTTTSARTDDESALTSASQETIEVLDLALLESMKENSELRKKVASLEKALDEVSGPRSSSTKKGGKKDNSSQCKPQVAGKATNTAAAPNKIDNSSQCSKTQVVGKATNTAASPSKKDNSSQCVKTHVVGKATNTASPSKKDNSSQCSKKKLVGKATNTVAAPKKKDAENNTISVPKIETAAQCTDSIGRLAEASKLVKVEFKTAESEKSGSLLAEASSNIENALEKWRVASSKRMVRLRRMITTKKEEFARLRENISNYEQKTDTMEVQLKALRSTLSVETAKRLKAEKELRELKIKFWELLSARQLQPWGPYNPDITSVYPAAEAEGGDHPVAAKAEQMAKSHVPQPDELTWRSQDVKKAAPGVVSFRKFLLPAVTAIAKTFQRVEPNKTSTPFSELKSEVDFARPTDEELTKFIESQPAFADLAGIFRPPEGAAAPQAEGGCAARHVHTQASDSSSQPFDFHLQPFDSRTPSTVFKQTTYSSAPQARTNAHETRSTCTRPIVSKTVSDRCATVTVSITSGLGTVSSTTEKFNLKNGKRFKVDSSTTVKSEPAKSGADIKDAMCVHRRVNSAQSRPADEKAASETQVDFADSKPQEPKSIVAKDLAKVKLLDELDQETDEWCPPTVEGNFTLAEGVKVAPPVPKMWAVPKTAADKRGRYASYAAITAGKFTRNDLARQSAADPQGGNPNSASVPQPPSQPASQSTPSPTPTPTTPPPLSSLFPADTSLPDVITTAPKPSPVVCGPNDISLHKEEETEMAESATPPRAFHFDPAKLYSHSVNQQIRQGKCFTCGMRFSPTVDRYLVEEHIYFHHTFTE
ncbi:hypothetical protein BaRGS_00023689 [Batillaria attramentaria]|uniref:SKICH domain-containing protein n=1 Tax=Batillaria attramentaria TaxID=370345 RepID=A0ABD0KD52_9CAEN